MMSKIAVRNCLRLICGIALMMLLSNPPTECYGFEIMIDVAPNTLNLGSQGQVVTVHTSIVYSDVDHENVFLNGIQVSTWKADNRGYFVAKFLMSEVKALADNGDLDVPGDNVLTVEGYTIDGAEFTGSQVITVIDIDPAGAGRR